MNALKSRVATLHGLKYNWLIKALIVPLQGVRGLKHLVELVNGILTFKYGVAH